MVSILQLEVTQPKIKTKHYHPDEQLKRKKKPVHGSYCPCDKIVRMSELLARVAWVGVGISLALSLFHTGSVHMKCYNHN